MTPARRRQDPPPGVQPDLFEQQEGTREGQWARAPGSAPLAARMRPRDLGEFVGQQDVIGPGKPLRLMVERDEVPSIVLWGPPGSGKTTLAAIVARRTQRYFERISAVNSGVADLRRAVADAQERRRVAGLGTILFIDELHRFNKAQQDAVLSYVKDGM